MEAEEQDGERALRSIMSMISRSEKAQVKFAAGTSQHTLQKNRIHALYVAAALIRAALPAAGPADEYTKEDYEKAGAPIASLISKSERAKRNLSPGTWQHAMLEDNLEALYRASVLLTEKLDSLRPV